MHIDSGRLTDLFVELVKINGPSYKERAVADSIIEKMKAWNFQFEIDDAGRKIKGDCGNLIIRIPGRAMIPCSLWLIWIQ